MEPLKDNIPTPFRWHLYEKAKDTGSRVEQNLRPESGRNTLICCAKRRAVKWFADLTIFSGRVRSKDLHRTHRLMGF